jgi:hypothetical protein
VLGPVADLVHCFRAQRSCIRLITGRPKLCPETFGCQTGALHKQRAEIAITTLADGPGGAGFWSVTKLSSIDDKCLIGKDKLTEVPRRVLKEKSGPPQAQINAQ